MKINKEKEKDFYSKYFYFSYSSLNKLLFSPSLFYKDYILRDREIRTDKHLIEGKLIHCLLFEPENLKDKFNIVPQKTPSDNVRKVLKDMTLYTDSETLEKCDDSVILDSLKSLNLYQSLKTDAQRIAKIKTEANEPYWEFLSNNLVIDVIDEDTLNRCKEQVEILKANKEVAELFNNDSTDFELDSRTKHCEKYLKCKLNTYDFGLHGYIDYYMVDDENKTITICDLKTTSKTISDFSETIEYYNYWLQAAIYSKLVYENENSDYAILFKFVVIDKYNQVYVFDVTEGTMAKWAEGLNYFILEAANHHYTERNFTLPYEFLKEKVKL